MANTKTVSAENPGTEIAYRTAKGKSARVIVETAKIETAMRKLADKDCYEFMVRDALVGESFGSVRS